MNKWLGLVAAATLAVTGSAATADDGDDWEFTLVNHSSVPIRQFNGYAGGAWSSNWLSYQVAPGDSVTLRFDDDATENCVVKTRITFMDDSYFEQDVDYCGMETIHVSDDTIWAE